MTKVLMIDDDKRICLTAQSLLAARGDYEFTFVTRAKAGLRAAKREKPDVVLLDINMPKMDGLKVLRALKDSRGTATIPVIMVTGDDSRDAKTEAMYEYADDYLVKPFSIDVIESKIDHVIALRR